MSTLVKRNGFPTEFSPSQSFFEDWTRNWFDNFGLTQEGNTVPRVNIVETDDDFQVEMAVPGMRKEDFHAELDNDTLTIWSEVSNDERNNDQSYTRREFSYRSFKRSFYLPNTVESDKIKAKYQDGVLRLIIPKKEEAKRKPAKTIAIN